MYAYNPELTRVKRDDYCARDAGCNKLVLPPAPNQLLQIIPSPVVNLV
jgi:hypothetical protein